MVLHQISAGIKTTVKLEEAEGDIPNIFLKWEKWDTDNVAEISLSFFLNDVETTFVGIKNQLSLRMLFCKSQTKYMIAIPLDYLDVFLCLFSLLHACKRISCSRSRGLFILLKAHLIALPHEKLPNWKDYRKLKCVAVERLKHNPEMLEKLKILFSKYCHGKEHQVFFDNFFLKK
jgi:hypothetical protein